VPGPGDGSYPKLVLPISVSPNVHPA